MRFRPCIDIHNGKVKQIVGGSLQDQGDQAQENYVAEQDAPFFARLYQSRGIRGGHIILLNPATSPYYEATRQQARGNFQKEFVEDEFLEDEEVNIIRTKKFGIKPMYPEDACVQMELLGHNFYVFRNAETDEVNVVYKRKGNTYGLIEPEC